MIALISSTRTSPRSTVGLSGSLCSVSQAAGGTHARHVGAHRPVRQSVLEATLSVIKTCAGVHFRDLGRVRIARGKMLVDATCGDFIPLSFWVVGLTSIRLDILS